jgi:hypothetical protein
LAALRAAAVEDESHGLGMRRACGQRLGDGDRELFAAVLVEQSQQMLDRGGEVALAAGQRDEQRLSSGNGAQQAILAAMQACLLLGLAQRRECVGRSRRRSRGKRRASKAAAGAAAAPRAMPVERCAGDPAASRDGQPLPCTSDGLRR